MGSLLIPGFAQAQGSDVQVEIRLEVQPGCSFSSVGEDIQLPDAVIDFGTATADADGPVDGAAASADGAPPLNLTCSTSYTNESAPTLTVDGGLHGEAGQRYMAGPNGVRIPYQLFQDRARNQPYDPATPVQLLIPTAGVAVPIGIYGRVARVTGLPDGRYTDTVTLTLTY